MLTFSVNCDINEVIMEGNLADARPTTDIGRQWWSEVIVKAIDGKTDDKVNIDAYGYVCERNTKMAVASTEVALLSVEEIEMGLRGVADTVAHYIDRNVDTIIESSEVKTLVQQFLEVQENLEIEEGVNLWRIVKLAKTQNIRMMDKLRDLISRYEIGEVIEGVLKNRECLEVLEGTMEC